MAVRVYPEPAALTIRLEKVATPEFTWLAVVPESETIAPFRCSVRLTVPLAAATWFPLLSTSATVTAGAIAAPAVESLGCVMKASFEAGSEIVYEPEVTALLCVPATANARNVTEDETLMGPVYRVEAAQGVDPSVVK